MRAITALHGDGEREPASAKRLRDRVERWTPEGPATHTSGTWQVKLTPNTGGNLTSPRTTSLYVARRGVARRPVDEKSGAPQYEPGVTGRGGTLSRQESERTMGSTKRRRSASGAWRCAGEST